MTLLIRQAELSDLDAVLGIGHGTWPSTYGPIAGEGYVAYGLARWWAADAVRPTIERGEVLVAEQDGALIGMTSFSPQDRALVVWKLYVLPDNQGSGAGSALLEKVIQLARGKYPSVKLSHVQGNDRAEAFYEARGFTVIGTVPGAADAPNAPEEIWRELQLDA
jgi:GNAT superfamily N-acetyltransferase